MLDKTQEDTRMPLISTTISDDSADQALAAPDLEGYQMLEQIGQGGMGTVWSAIQKGTQRKVALKILGTGAMVSSKARLRFEREVELTARLEHPNIASIYDSGIHKGMHYYAMEYIEGIHLDQYIDQPQLTQRKILKLIRSICLAVQYAHQRGVIHRDLKPSNVLITPDGQPHIVDFGLAKALQDEDDKLTISVEGDVAGTPAFMSPEQARGEVKSIDTRSDVYSIGVILYHLLTRQWPHDMTRSRYEVLKSIQEEEPILPTKFDKKFDPDVQAILMKALSVDLNQRYQSMSELAHDIQCFLDGMPIVAKSVNSIYILKKLMRRHWQASAVAGLLLVIITSTAFISFYSYIQKEKALNKSEQDRMSYRTKDKENQNLAYQIGFASFLESWHNDKIQRAKIYATYFPSTRIEKAGAYFLLDPRPLDKKIRDLDKMAQDNASFKAFIMGEYHLKNDDIAKAIKWYKQCLEESSYDTEPGLGYIKQAERTLAAIQKK